MIHTPLFMLETRQVGYPNSRNKPGVFKPVLSNRPSGPREGNSKVAIIKQGVQGALRSKNLRLLLEAASAPEDVAVLAEVPLERLQNMAEGALCTDETAYHLEQQLQLPSGWLDKMNPGMPDGYTRLLQTLHSTAQAIESEVQVEVHTSPLLMPLAPESTVPDKIEAVDIKVPVTAPIVVDVSAPSLELTPSLPEHTALALSPSLPPKETTMPTSSEVHLDNLKLLLLGKGAKSAMARLLNLSPASVTGMINGVKALDAELLGTITNGLSLPADWFEAPRTLADIPAIALQGLSPLARGSSVPSPTPKKGAQLSLPSQEASGSSVLANNVASDSVTNQPTTWPAESKLSRLRDLGVIGPETGASGVTSQPSPAVPSAVASPAITRSTPVLNQGITEAPPLNSVTLTLDPALSPIAEALIKTLTQKAANGLLTEDHAFDLLGKIRAL